MPDPKQKTSWLVRPETIRLLWVGFVIVLAVTLVADVFVDRHGESGIAGTFGFYAWFGFACCVILIFVARGLGLLLKRPADYYDR